MPRVIQAWTGTRLHFGPLASGATEGRCFGGIGMMVTQPAISFRASESDEERFVGCSPATIERIRGIRSVWRAACEAGQGVRSSEPTAGLPPLSWEFETAPVEHAGFGTGTQLSLAVASVLSRFDGNVVASIHQLAQRCGRGRRSAIGLYGFAEGGFLVDAGKSGQESLGELAIRLPVPDSWKVIIIRPRTAIPGLSGTRESAAFAALPPMSPQLTDRLCRLTLMEILPAIRSGDCDGFSVAVSEYGRLIGGYFSRVQGGVFADPQIREIAHSHPKLGQILVQSSWGPSVVAFAPSASWASEMCREWEGVLSPDRFLVNISSPLNHGAVISEVTPSM